MNRLAIVGTCAALLFAGNASADDLELEIANQIYAGTLAHMAQGWERLEQQNVSFEDLMTSRGEGIRRTDAYGGLLPNKALTVCVAWNASDAESVTLRAGGVSWRNPFIDDAVRTALFGCEKKKAQARATDCECQVLAKNDDLVLEVPASFLDRIRSSEE
jgi:hypothetical protein